MPESLAGQIEGDKPADPEVVKPPESAPDAGEAAAPTEAATKDEGSKSILDAVTAALGKDKSEGSSPSEGSEDRGAAKPAEGDKPEDENAELEEPTAEELAGYHSKTRRRIKGLLNQRNEARAEIEKLKPAADGWTGLQSYMAEANLTTDEVNQGFEIMRLMKHEPAKALQALLPFVHRLQTIVGDILPTDIEKAVQTGELSEQHARELSRARSSASLAEAQSRAAAERAEALAKAQGFERHAAAVAKVVNEWDARQATSDPDYALKRARIMEKTELALHKQGFPQTSQAALELVTKAKQEVDEEFKRLSPKRPEVKPGPGVGSAPAAKRAPTTIREAMDAALGV